ncbi:hypothetical protein B0H17DRAFT_1031269 [Mycena rosella]|uniref:Uncharacterized protein n=1 Tax=Mycena rosella TaxID=1033263 RepID=A0AAD7H098_MYCRO|nr:hypothetical protein B0H17DRAFT_1031269 [Mycena rosella]
MEAIFESLQREFCPPLDSSLLAALLADIDLDDAPVDANPQIAALRSTLIELAAHADESQGLDDFSCSDETSSVPDFCTSTTTTTTSDFSGAPFNSPLAFLQAALPHIPRERLVQAVETAADEPDMWELISFLLSEETARELSERDLDAGELAPLDGVWAPVPASKKGKPKKKPARAATIALTDVRQQQHHRPVLARSRTDIVDDPWTQLASLASHLAALLPPHPPTLFQSFFHAPAHAHTPYAALCAALASIAPPPTAEAEAETTTSSALFHLLDALLPAYPLLPPAHLVADAELALAAAHGRPEDAFELVRVLRDLDAGALGGVYHAPAPASPVSLPSPLPFALAAPLPTGPAPTPPPPNLKLKPPLPPSASAAPGGWQPVPVRLHRCVH